MVASRSTSNCPFKSAPSIYIRGVPQAQPAQPDTSLVLLLVAGSFRGVVRDADSPRVTLDQISYEPRSPVETLNVVEITFPSKTPSVLARKQSRTAASACVQNATLCLDFPPENLSHATMTAREGRVNSNSSKRNIISRPPRPAHRDDEDPCSKSASSCPSRRAIRSYCTASVAQSVNPALPKGFLRDAKKKRLTRTPCGPSLNAHAALPHTQHQRHLQFCLS